MHDWKNLKKNFQEPENVNVKRIERDSKIYLNVHPSYFNMLKQ